MQDIEDLYPDSLPLCELFIKSIVKSEFTNLSEFNNIYTHFLKTFKITPPSRRYMLYVYNYLLKKNVIRRNFNFENICITKHVRSWSGVLVVTVVLKPDEFSCNYNCHYCPNETIENDATCDMPRSYLSTEDAVKRGINNDFDAAGQLWERVNALKKNGHNIDKLEIIVLGGTFNTYNRKYTQEFCRDLYFAANTYYEIDQRNRTRNSITEEQLTNQYARLKIIGLSLETRPEFAKNKHELIRMRHLGCTRIQIGVQHTDNDVLDYVNRGHTVQDSIDAIKMMKQFGFKVDIHIMPDLPGTTIEKDRSMITKIIMTSDFQPDYLKIYPCLDVKYTEIRKWKQNGKWKPYAEQNNGKDLIELIIYAKQYMPTWTRINRIQRDFPNEKENYPGFISDNIKSNLRQQVLNTMKKRDLKCRCIRCREIKNKPFNKNNIKIVIKSYKASDGIEYFISCDSIDNEHLYGFCRLRINDSSFHHPMLDDKPYAFIRELHVYGKVTPVNQSIKNVTQHNGIGKKLIQTAEKIAQTNNIDNIAIISGVGVREYYKNLGYTLHNTYMVKSFSHTKYKNICFYTDVLTISFLYLIFLIFILLF